MDVRSLRYFQTVAECGSFSRGSKLLRISQPAVSRTIRELEDELQCRLFSRGSAGVTLTEQGKALLERSQVILHDLERVKQDILGGNPGPSGVVTLAIPPGVGHLVVPELALRLNTVAPSVALRVFGGFSSYIKELLIRRHVDLACTHEPFVQNDFSIQALLEEEVFVVGRTGSFPTDAPVMATGDLVQLPLILPARPNSSRRLLDRWAEPAGLQLHPKFEVDDHLITRGLLSKGVGFALLTRSAIERELAEGKIEARSLSPSAYWPLALMSGKRHSRSHAVDVVAEALQSTVSTLIETHNWPGARSDNNQISRKRR